VRSRSDPLSCSRWPAPRALKRRPLPRPLRNRTTSLPPPRRPLPLRRTRRPTSPRASPPPQRSPLRRPPPSLRVRPLRCPSRVRPQRARACHCGQSPRRTPRHSSARVTHDPSRSRRTRWTRRIACSPRTGGHTRDRCSSSTATSGCARRCFTSSASDAWIRSRARCGRDRQTTGSSTRMASRTVRRFAPRRRLRAPGATPRRARATTAVRTCSPERTSASV
jgi:hypothetical protein